MAVAFFCALLIESILTRVTALALGRGSGYGAPLTVGTSPEGLLFAAGETSFDPARFLLNVTLTAILLLGLARWAGNAAALWSVVAGACPIAVLLLMAVMNLPVAGLPLPIWDGSPISVSVTLWFDVLLWSSGVGAFLRWRRADHSRNS